METPEKITSKKFLSSQFSLPLFILSRNRIILSKFNEVRTYIKNRAHLYEKDNCEGSVSATLSHLQHVISGRHFYAAKNKEKQKALPEYSRKQLTKSWQLPPNLYDTISIPYARRRGIGGAYWSKDRTSKAKTRPDDNQSPAGFYNLPKITEKLFATCNQSKGVFLTNARDRRATTRCMVSDLGTCYKNPSDPGPATYSPFDTQNIPSISLKFNAPHLFYRSSIVPVRKNSIHTTHTSFSAAPGRYETRYPRICPCSSKLIYQPQIDLLIQKEKRNKFRRLAYQKMNAQRYASPDFRHVKGRGFRYLFTVTKPMQQKRLTEQEIKSQKNIQLYPDSKYLSMINNPLRTPLSFRSSPTLTSMPTIHFNSTAKKVMRKHLKINKKIVFNSSQERFPDSYRLPILTQKQQEELKKTLPPERQFRDHPITNKSLSDITPKLDQIPKHMLPNYAPKLRKKIFKFQSLPQPKVLVTRSDRNTKDIGKEGFFFSLVEANKFFKDN